MTSVSRLKRLTPVFALAAAVTFSTGLLQGQSSDRAKNLGTKIMCTCGGCNDTAGTCSHPGASFTGPCDVAKHELAELDTRVSGGGSDDLILQSFVQEYGEQVLVEPPTRGFSALAWMIPGIAFGLGLALVVVVLRQWRHRVALTPATSPAVSSETSERVRRQIDRETDD